LELTVFGESGAPSLRSLRGLFPKTRLETVANEILRLPFASGRGLTQTCRHPAAVFSERVAASSVRFPVIFFIFFLSAFAARVALKGVKGAAAVPNHHKTRLRHVGYGWVDGQSRAMCRVVVARYAVCA